MTLTQDLSCSSPVRDYLDRHLTDLGPYQDAWPDQCAPHPEIGDISDGYDPDTAARCGLAMEWAIGFDLAQAVPYRSELDGFSADGGDRAAALVSAAGFQPPNRADPVSSTWTNWQRRYRPSDLPERDALRLVTACWNLTKVITLLHDPEHAEPGGVLTAPHVWQMVYTPIEETPWLSSLWSAYRRFGRAQLDALGLPVDVAVKLIDRYAVADLILGSTLVDIKCTIEPEPKLREWLLQTLAYALLTGHRPITRVGVYLVRQARLVTWRVADLLPGLDLEQARHEFTAIVTERAPA
ncbi:hypothetical protein [Glycomyces salinus]|uniref:hypothetical protein n=1 Tax=Glycomyces salinus TaxID=980294 RepID=UPI0018EBF2D7|nr:hypothetical protein [Glycomyces salinus]